MELAAGTAFVELGRFSGRPDSIVLHTSHSQTVWRISDRGRPPHVEYRTAFPGYLPIDVRGEVIEVSDATGVNTPRVTAIGRYASRQIDVRSNNPGPSRERPMLPDEARATQVPTAE